jgi:hypothetical protein
MKTTSAFRVAIGAAGILAATLTLSGCMGSPTYGTDKTAMEHLVDDLGSSVAIAPKSQDTKRNLKYNPRPSLVVATKQQGAELPPPQASLANRENNANWVESPEETRARLREEADENKDNPRYRSPLLAGKGQAGQLTESQKWEAFRKAKADAENVDIAGTPRRSLAEPPTQYRQADAAVLADVGEPESQKEKRRKKEAAAAGKNSSWWQPFQ